MKFLNHFRISSKKIGIIELVVFEESFNVLQPKLVTLFVQQYNVSHFLNLLCVSIYIYINNDTEKVFFFLMPRFALQIIK